MLLLKQNTTRKEQIDKSITKLDADNGEKYKVEAIWDSAIYAKKLKSHLLKLYYLVA